MSSITILGTVSGNVEANKTTVLIAGDDADTKSALSGAITTGLDVVR